MMRRGSAQLVGTYRRCHVFVSLLVSTAGVFLPVGKGWIKKFALLLLLLLLTWSALIGVAMCLCRCLLAQPVCSFLLAKVGLRSSPYYYY